MSKYTKTLLKGASIIFVMGIITSLLSYLIRILLAQKLDPETFGLFFAIYNVALLIGWMKGLGFSAVIPKFIPEFKVNGEEGKIKSTILFVMLFSLFTSVVAIGIVFFFPEHIINNFFHSGIAKPILLALIIFVILEEISKLISIYLLAIHQAFLYSLREFLLKLLIFSSLYLFLNNEIFAVVKIYLLVTAITLSLNIIFFLRNFPFFHAKTNIDKPLIKRLFSFSTPLMLKDFFGAFLSNVDNLILVYYRPLTEVAIYNAILPNAELLLIICRPFSRVIFPIASEMKTIGNDKIQWILKMTHKYLLLALVPIAGAMIYFSEFILDLLFGDIYIQGALSLKILSVGFLFSGLNMVSYSVLKGIGKPKEVAGIHISKSILNFILNLLLIPFFGIYGLGFLGAVIATASSFFSAFLLTTYFLNKNLNYRHSLKEFILTALSGFGALYLADFLLKNMGAGYLKIVLTLMLFSMIYLAFVFSLRVTSIKEIKGVLKIFMNKKIER